MEKLKQKLTKTEFDKLFWENAPKSNGDWGYAVGMADALRSATLDYLNEHGSFEPEKNESRR